MTYGMCLCPHCHEVMTPIGAERCWRCLFKNVVAINEELEERRDAGRIPEACNSTLMIGKKCYLITGGGVMVTPDEKELPVRGMFLFMEPYNEVMCMN